MKEFVLGALRVPMSLVWRAVVAAFVVGTAAAAVTALTPRRYSAGFAMVPQVSDAGNSGLSSIASQLGVNLGTIDLTQSPLFYSELLGSKAFMIALAGTAFRVESRSELRDTLLYDWLDSPGVTPSQRRERGSTLLRDRVAISASPRSGIVRFTVAVNDSALARQIAARALWQIDSFNLRIKQSQARAERVFLEQRSDSLGRLLRQAEEALVIFDDRNRAAVLSPALRIERERISREARVLEGVYQLVRQQLERTRMDEVRNTPVVTVIEEVRSPAWPERRFLLFKTIAAASVTWMLWIGTFLFLTQEATQGVIPRNVARRMTRLIAGAGGEGSVKQ